MEKFSSLIDYNTQFPDFVTLRIKGEIRINVLEPIQKNLESIYPGCKGKKVLFDLSETAYVSSSGWSLILSAYQNIQDRGGRLLLTGMTTEVRNAFELLEFQEFMENYPTLADAYQEALKEELFLPQGKFPREKVDYF